MKQNRIPLVYALLITGLLLAICTVWTWQRVNTEVNAAFESANAVLIENGREPLTIWNAVAAHKINGKVWPQYKRQTADGTPCGSNCHAQASITEATKYGATASGVLLFFGLLLGNTLNQNNPRRNLINLDRDRIAIDKRNGDAFPVIRSKTGRRTWGIMQRPHMRGTGRRQYGSAAILGAPGRGKSNLLKSWLLTADTTNFVVIDLKGDLYKTTAGHRATLGPVVRLDLSSTRGHAIDPLARATPTEVANFAAQLVGKSGDFWTRSAANLAEAFIFAAQAAKVPPVAALIESASLTPLDMASYAKSLIESAPQQQREKLERDFKKVLERAWDGKGDKLNNQDAGVIDGYSSAVKSLNIPEIASTLTQTSFKISDLVRKRMTVYISLPFTEKPYKLPTELLMSAIIRGVFSEADKRGAGENIVLLADEAGVLEIPLFSDAIAEGRGRNFSIFAFVQSAGQLSQYTDTNKWQDLKNIITHWTFLGSPSQDDVRRHLNEMCGYYDEMVKDRKTGEQREVARESFAEFAARWKESEALAILDYDRRYVVTGAFVHPYNKRLQRLSRITPPKLPTLTTGGNLGQPPTQAEEGHQRHEKPQQEDEGGIPPQAAPKAPAESGETVSEEAKNPVQVWQELDEESF